MCVWVVLSCACGLCCGEEVGCAVYLGCVHVWDVVKQGTFMNMLSQLMLAVA